jgi:hypothetical protein
VLSTRTEAISALSLFVRLLLVLSACLAVPLTLSTVLRLPLPELSRPSAIPPTPPAAFPLPAESATAAGLRRPWFDALPLAFVDRFSSA